MWCNLPFLLRRRNEVDPEKWTGDPVRVLLLNRGQMLGGYRTRRKKEGRKHSPVFHALEVMKVDKAVAPLVDLSEVPSGQIQARKKAVTEGAAGVFGNT